MSDNAARLAVQIPAELKRKLEEQAKDQHRSVAKQVAFILEWWLENVRMK